MPPGHLCWGRQDRVTEGCQTQRHCCDASPALMGDIKHGLVMSSRPSPTPCSAHFKSVLGYRRTCLQMQTARDEFKMRGQNVLARQGGQIQGSLLGSATSGCLSSDNSRMVLFHCHGNPGCSGPQEMVFDSSIFMLYSCLRVTTSSLQGGKGEVHPVLIP